MEFLLNGNALTNGEALMLLCQYKDDAFCRLSHDAGVEFELLNPDGKMTADTSAYSQLEGFTRVYSTETSMGIARMGFFLPDAFCDEARVHDPADAYDFVASLVGVSHECQHAFQFLYDMHRDDYVGSVMCVNRYATQENQVYSLLNYFCDPAEVDAQLAGLYFSMDYLEGLVGSDAALAYINMYHDRRARSIGTDFVNVRLDRGYESKRDMCGDYEAAFQFAVHMRRSYDLDIGLSLGDPAARFFKSYPSLYSAFNAERDGFEQDRMVASTYFRTPVQKKYVLEQVNADTGVDLSVQSVFEKPALVRMLSFSKKGRITGEYTVESRFAGRRLPDLSGLDMNEGSDGPDF